MKVTLYLMDQGKLMKIMESLAEDISRTCFESSVDIGEKGGVVFRVQALRKDEAEDNGFDGVGEEYNCIK